RRWGAGKSVCGTVRKKGISGRCLPTRCETGPSRLRWKPRGPTPPKNLYREVVRPIQELESESQNGNPGLKRKECNWCRKLHSCGEIRLTARHSSVLQRRQTWSNRSDTDLSILSKTDLVYRPRILDRAFTFRHLQSLLPRAIWRQLRPIQLRGTRDAA